MEGQEELLPSKIKTPERVVKKSNQELAAQHGRCLYNLFGANGISAW